MKNLIKKIVIMAMTLTLFLSETINVFAYNTTNVNYSGYAYNLYTITEKATLKNIHVKAADTVTITFTYNDTLYNRTYNKNENGQFESMFNLKGKKYYSMLQVNNNEYSGIVRDVTQVANTDTEQFGFIITNNNSKLNSYKKALTESVQTGELKSLKINNSIVLSQKALSTVSAITTRSMYNVKAAVYAPLNTSFGEVWGYVSGTPNYKTCRVVQYNILIGVWGDGASLRECGTGYSKTLWSTPVRVPRGLQSVEKTYNVSYNYTGCLDVTVTGLYDIYKVPLPIPVIYADGVNF